MSVSPFMTTKTRSFNIDRAFPIAPRSQRLRFPGVQDPDPIGRSIFERRLNHVSEMSDVEHNVSGVVVFQDEDLVFENASPGDRCQRFGNVRIHRSEASAQSPGQDECSHGIETNRRVTLGEGYGGSRWLPLHVRPLCKSSPNSLSAGYYPVEV